MQCSVIDKTVFFHKELTGKERQDELEICNTCTDISIATPWASPLPEDVMDRPSPAGCVSCSLFVLPCDSVSLHSSTGHIAPHLIFYCLSLPLCYGFLEGRDPISGIFSPRCLEQPLALRKPTICWLMGEWMRVLFFACESSSTRPGSDLHI